MTEHEELHKLNKIIWYIPKFDFEKDKETLNDDYLCYYEWSKGTWISRIVNVREIIFQPDFMNKFRAYYDKNGTCIKDFFNWTKASFENLDDNLKWEILNTQLSNLLWNNLHNPVNYLVSLIK